MHVRQEPSSGGAECESRYSTLPDLMATRQLPQLPARQPDSSFTPCSSARSNNVPTFGFHSTLFRERLNVTLTSGAFFKKVVVTDERFTVAGPNASNITSLSGTPQSRNPVVILSMNELGPHRK